MAVVRRVVEAGPRVHRVEHQDVCAGLEELEHAADLAVHGGEHQGGLLVPIHGVRLRPAIQEHGERLEAAIGGGDVERGEAVVERGAAGEGGVGGEQRAQGVEVPELGRAEEVVLVAGARAAHPDRKSVV